MKRVFSILTSCLLLGLNIGTTLYSYRSAALDSYNTAMANMAGAQGMAGLSGADAAGSAKDCACLSKTPPVPCPTPPAGACPLMGSNIASIAQALAQAMSAGGSGAAVQGSEGFNYDPEDYKFDYTPTDPYVPPILGGTNPDDGWGCNGPNPPAYICSSTGLDDLDDDLNSIPSTAELSPQQIQEVNNAKKSIGALKAGDIAGALSALGQDIAAITKNGDTLNSASVHGDKSGTAGTRGFASAAGLNANYSGTAGGAVNLSASGAKATRRVGNIDIYLDDTEWNGELDAINGKSGKSLTLWERATRRYMGTPEGKRGFTLANIESIRYRNTPQFAKEEQIKAEQRAAALAKKNSSPKDDEFRAPASFPGLISPKQLIGY